MATTTWKLTIDGVPLVLELGWPEVESMARRAILNGSGRCTSGPCRIKVAAKPCLWEATYRGLGEHLPVMVNGMHRQVTHPGKAGTKVQVKARTEQAALEKGRTALAQLFEAELPEDGSRRFFRPYAQEVTVERIGGGR